MDAAEDLPGLIDVISSQIISNNCVLVSKGNNIYIYIIYYIYIYIIYIYIIYSIYIYIILCVCAVLCVCVCAKMAMEKERERESERELYMQACVKSNDLLQQTYVNVSAA